ncbi:MAG: hypothetical protein ABI921_08245 [Panacibacter sp.]
MKVIRSYEELHQLHINLYKFDIYRKSETYKTALPQWDADQNSRITNIINRYSKKCGCTSGTFVMLLFFIGYILQYFLNGGTFALVGLQELIELAAYTAGGAIAGKLLGLFYARWQLIHFVHKLL